MRVSKNKLIVLFFVSGLSLIFSCYRGLRYHPPPPPYITPETKYPVGPGDSIEVKIFPDEIGISGVYELDDEGKIIMPLVGAVYLVGMTSIQIKEEIVKLYTQYIKNPYVSVYIRSMKSHKIYVWTPERVGIIFMQRPLSILEAFIMAEGSPKDVKLSNIYIIRWNEKEKKSDIYSVNIEKIIKEGDFTQNVYLSPGDIVFLPPTNLKSALEILGIYSRIGFSLIYGIGGLQVIGVAK